MPRRWGRRRPGTGGPSRRRGRRGPLRRGRRRPLRDRIAALELEVEKWKTHPSNSGPTGRTPSSVVASPPTVAATTGERQARLVRNARLHGLAAFENESSLESPIPVLQDRHGFVYGSPEEQRRWDATLEYLRNVALRFLTANNADVRRRLLPVLATVLNFSPAEVQRIERANRLWRPAAAADPWTLVVGYLNTL
eukprot:TRINITY_DN17096_c0_g1_i1.p2 TRINITY_DN17096_c0_g1~~TRINITY_DN17096_c0_g1_i1.p2  ORF type:complete len:195 (-),score=55.07 TRINITY_DN17096_c0_g1_i1:371-955(-)